MYYFLVNPTAGGGRAMDTAKTLEAHLKAEGLEYEFGYSQYHKHAIELVRDAVERGHRKIFALGGDGTIFEAVNGVVASGFLEETAIGFLPAGTGNDFTRSIELSRDPVAAFEQMKDGKTVEVDLWQANGRYFINVFGLGLDVDLTGWAAKTKKLLSGLPAYVAALLLTLVSFKFKKIRLTVGNEVLEREVVVLTASNGRFYGGGILVAPDARLHDRKIDLVFISRMAKIKIPFVLLKYIAGRHIAEVKECEYLQADGFEVEGDGIINCETDGELELAAPVKIERAGRGIRVMVGSDFSTEED